MWRYHLFYEAIIVQSKVRQIQREMLKREGKRMKIIEFHISHEHKNSQQNDHQMNSVPCGVCLKNERSLPPSKINQHIIPSG